MEKLNTYNTFQSLGKNAPLPPGYQRIKGHFIYAVKYDLRHRA